MNDEIIIKMINQMIKTVRTEGNISMKDVSDGNHTFRELYTHRTILFALLCNAYKNVSWKSKKHYDEETDPMFNGCFIAGINTSKGSAIYHLKLKYWDLFDIPELERGYPYDGHSSDEDLVRLLSLMDNSKEKENKVK